MQAERDHLKNIVFPMVEEELRKKRIRLETVDLRWGVDTASVNEDEREATILKVCIEEIERCKPFFIGLLGDRYGWVPPEERIENATRGRKLLLPNKGKSVTALEIEFGVLASSEQLNRSVFYLREPLPYEKLSPEKAAKFSDHFDSSLSEEEKRIRKEALDDLRQAIGTHFDSINLPGKVKTYTAKLNYVSGTVVYGLEPWGEVVYKDILAECETHAKDTWGEVPKDQHEEELALLDSFIEEHTHITTTITEKGEEQVHTFCGREKLIGELKEYLLSDGKDKWGLVLTGESGSGKSAVFSMMYKTMIREDCIVLAHSAGISPTAKGVAELLRKWNRQLSEYLGIEEQGILTGDYEKTAPKPEIEKMQEKFAELLLQASGKKRVILLVDALDRFEPTSRAQYITWLPQSPHVNVKLLATAIAGTEKNAVQYHKGFVSRSIDHFTHEEAGEMLHSLGRKQHKSLPEEVEREILEKQREDGLKACSSPLWLSLAVNILMAMDADDFEKMSGLKGKGEEQIKSYMLEMVKQFPALPGDLFLDLIKRAARIFGESFTVFLFDFIACSRNGLRESDLEVLLPKQTAHAWDPLLFAGLRRWFRVHLVEQGEGHQWNLGHSILRGTIEEKIEPENYNNLNIALSTHLLSLPLTDALRIADTMFHLLQQDDKLPAIKYYTSELEIESLSAATRVLSETVTSGEKGLDTITSFPPLTANDKGILSILMSRFIYTLDDYLSEEGNLNQRLVILNSLTEAFEKCHGDQAPTLDSGYNKGALIEKLGEIHQATGHIEEAFKYFDKKVRLIKELYDSNPRDESLKNSLAISYSKLGEIHQAMGHMEEALKYFEEVVRLSRELSESNPRNELLKNDLAISYSKLGDFHQDMGHMEEALKYFDMRSALGKELYVSNPRNESLKNGLAISYHRLGAVNEAEGKLEEALLDYENYKNLMKELLEDNPKSEKYKDGFAISYSKLGEIHQAMGHMEETLKYFEEAVRLFKELYESNPLNESLKNGLATSYEKLGDIHQVMGRMEDALKYFDEALKLSKELYESNPRNVNLHEGLGISYYKLAMICKEMGKNDKGNEYFALWKNIISFLAKNLPQVPKYKKWKNLEY